MGLEHIAEARVLNLERHVPAQAVGKLLMVEAGRWHDVQYSLMELDSLLHAGQVDELFGVSRIPVLTSIAVVIVASSFFCVAGIVPSRTALDAALSHRNPLALVAGLADGVDEAVQRYGMVKVGQSVAVILAAD